MESALISAMAALGGSFIGSMAPVLANYVAQRAQTQRELLTHEIAQRESLYADFIRDAAKLYAKSLSSNLETLDEMVALYALVSRLRLIASDAVLQCAETLTNDIGNQYSRPNLTMAQIGALGHSGAVNPLGEFSKACRTELRDIMRWNSKLVNWRKQGHWGW